MSPFSFIFSKEANENCGWLGGAKIESGKKHEPTRVAAGKRYEPRHV